MKTKTIKKKLLLIIVFLISIMSSVAQNKNSNRIKMLKVSYISNAIELTSNEAEKFWPIYNKYYAKIKQLKPQLHPRKLNSNEDNSPINSMSEKKAKELVYNILNTENEIVKTKKLLVEDLTAIISYKKIVKLQIAERDFNQRMLQEFGKRKRMNMNRQ